MDFNYITTLWFILIPVGTLCDVVTTVNDSLLVTTTSGLIQGTWVESNISNFAAFFSIPYAKPPLLELRFKPPEPVDPWESILDATEQGPMCAQTGSTDTSEDCLTLNIYTDNLSGVNRSVLVFLHGGGLETDSAKIGTYGPHYLVNYDIIVVTLQFRLDIFGFLNLGIEDAPGNMGLMDAVQALRWLQQNIEHFGGDPYSITLCGQSSGAIMTHAMLLSPMAQGLFSKVILESGTSLSYRFFRSNASEAIEKTKQQLNLTATNEQVLEYLKELDTEDLLNITQSIKRPYVATGYAEYYPFVITIENIFEGQDNFLINSPIDLIKEKKYSPVPMLIGINSDEGIRLRKDMNILDLIDKNFQIVVPTDLYGIDVISEEKNETAAKIKKFYFGDENLSSDTFDQYAILGRDSWYTHIVDYVVRLQSTVGYEKPVYYYEFSVDGAYNFKIIKGNKLPGASHSDELTYMWLNDYFVNIKATDDYSDLTRERMLAMWSNFVKYCNPTPEVTDILPITWETVDYPTVKYLSINQTLAMEEAPYRNATIFWQQLYGYDVI